MEHIIRIDGDKCIGCKMCIHDCPEVNISLINNKAKILSLDCMKCGHCVAICPKKAVSISGYEKDVEEIPDNIKIDPEILLNALKFRRTIRNFKQDKVDDNITEKIIEAGKWTPSARNSQDVSYVILRNEMENVEEIAVGMFNKILPFIRIFSKSARKIEIDDNFFFKKAPLAILIVSKNKIDGSLAASNMALMAESNGLGVLYSGLFSIAANNSRKIRKKLNIKGKNIVTTLVLGYPNIKYSRGVQKKEPLVIKK